MNRNADVNPSSRAASYPRGLYGTPLPKPLARFLADAVHSVPSSGGRAEARPRRAPGLVSPRRGRRRCAARANADSSSGRLPALPWP